MPFSTLSFKKPIKIRLNYCPVATIFTSPSVMRPNFWLVGNTHYVYCQFSLPVAHVQYCRLSPSSPAPPPSKRSLRVKWRSIWLELGRGLWGVGLRGVLTTQGGEMLDMCTKIEQANSRLIFYYLKLNLKNRFVLLSSVSLLKRKIIDPPSRNHIFL